MWANDFEDPLVWLRVQSPSVIASMNNNWFVWGSGSQSLNSGMYAFNWKTNQILYLGNAEGYSRPTIAQDSNTVMVPFLDDKNPALSFLVGVLPEG